MVRPNGIRILAGIVASGLAALLAGGCGATPEPAGPGRVAVNEEYLTNSQPQAVLDVPGYGDVFEDSERGRAEACYRARAEAATLAKMASQVAGIQFVRRTDGLRLAPKPIASEPAVGEAKVRRGTAIAWAKATRTAEGLTAMSRLEVIHVQATAAPSTALSVAETFRAMVWEAIQHFAVEKHGLDATRPLKGAATFVDLRVDAGRWRTRLSMQIHVDFPRSAPKPKHRPSRPGVKRKSKIPAVLLEKMKAKPRKTKTPADEMPPALREYLRK